MKEEWAASEILQPLLSSCHSTDVHREVKPGFARPPFIEGGLEVVLMCGRTLVNGSASCQ